MSHVKTSNAHAAETIIKKLEKRNMEGFFCETSEEAVEKALSLMPEGASISWGGTETVKECGLMAAIQDKNYVLIDRATATTPQEQREIYAKTVMSDFFLMSSNAVTMEGELVNIDGFANRVACLCAGPANVIVIAGMNKVVKDVQGGIDRIHTKAAPPNAVRLNRDTPCAKHGVCGNCYTPDCICSEILVTRRSSVPNRIKVILVNEDLGF